MQQAGWQAGWIGIRRREAEDVGVAKRLGAQAGPHGIADHSSDAGVGTAVGFDGAGVVVCFDFKYHVIIVIEFDDTGVVREDLHAPILFAQLLADGLRGLEDRFLEHVLEMLRPVLVDVGDAASQRLVAAVLAPGLGDGLQFDVGWIAAQTLEMRLDGLHLGQRQVQLAGLAELHKLLAVEFPNWDPH